MSWLTRVRNVFRKDELDRELDEELRYHAEQRAADLGLPVAETERRLGNLPRLREASRDVKLATWLESVLQDIRIALRVWRKRPIVTMAAILTIALGAGMNIALFLVIWTVMLKPLPYPDAGRLVQVWVDDGKQERTPPTNKLIERWRAESRALTQIASYRPWRVTVGTGGDPEQVFGGLVSAEFFATLGARFLAGRAFSAEEMKPGADNVIILREGYWRRRFNADHAIVGHDISVDGMLCTVRESCRTHSLEHRSFRVPGGELTRNEAEKESRTSIYPFLGHAWRECAAVCIPVLWSRDSRAPRRSNRPVRS